MAIIKAKPTSPGRRGVISIKTDLYKGKPLKSLTKVKYLLNRFVNESSISYFLEKCIDFNSSFNEAKVYEHEWSHSLSSYYEYLVHDPENNKIHMLIMTYE